MSFKTRLKDGKQILVRSRDGVLLAEILCKRKRRRITEGQSKTQWELVITLLDKVDQPKTTG